MHTHWSELAMSTDERRQAYNTRYQERSQLVTEFTASHPPVTDSTGRTRMSPEDMDKLIKILDEFDQETKRFFIEAVKKSKSAKRRRRQDRVAAREGRWELDDEHQEISKNSYHSRLRGSVSELKKFFQ